MGILLRKHHGTIAFTGIAKFAFVIFLVSLSAAFIDTIWAVYLNGFLQNESFVGLYSGFLSVLVFLSFFLLVPLVEKSNKSKLYAASLLILIVLFVLFALNKNLIFFIILSIIGTIITAVRITSMGTIVRDISRKSTISKNEGFVYSFNNIAWVFGPLIVGLILLDFGISYVFLSSAFLVFFAFILFKMSGIRDANVMRKIHANVFKNFMEFFRNKERTISYFIGAGVTFWWVLIYLYMPLFILENGLKESFIGIFLFAAALPLIVFEYPFSKAAGKFGAKKFFLMGYLFMFAISVLAFFFVSQIYIVLGILVLGSIGMAMLEPTTEAYFFDIIKNKKEENRFYGPYNTAIEVGLIFGKVAPAILLIFLPFKYIFIIFGTVMFLLFLLSFKARNIVEGRRR
ncbi:MFS transporter [Candidatus Pacearchaeota archaeon]|nr:MFS transporter [Candidatus Pacearchaeota archaeon]